MMEYRDNIAEQYNTSKQYTIGMYCINDNILYRCKINNIGSWDSSNWEFIRIMDEVSDLKSDLKSALIAKDIYEVTGRNLMTFFQGRYATVTSSPIGETVSYINFSGYRCAIEPCSEGDMFTLHVGGPAGIVRAWYFVNENMVVLDAAASLLNDICTIQAPTGSAYIIVNNQIDIMPFGYYAYKTIPNYSNIGCNLLLGVPVSKGKKLSFSSSGSDLISDPAWNTTEYIPIKGINELIVSDNFVGGYNLYKGGIGESYKIYSNGQVGYREQDASFFSGALTIPINTVTVNHDADYIRLSFSNDRSINNTFVYNFDSVLRYLCSNRLRLDSPELYLMSRSLNKNNEISWNSLYDITNYIDVHNTEKIYVSDGFRYVTYDDNYQKVGTGNLYSEPESYSGFKVLDTTNVSYVRIARSHNNKNFAAYGSPKIDIVEALCSPSKGSKIYFLGDSITRGTYANPGSSQGSGQTPYCYAYYVAAINHYDFVNLGESGGGFVNKGTQTNSDAVEIVDRNDFSDADYVTIAYGVNDWKSSTNIQLGSINTSTPNDGTVIGNMMYVINKIMDDNPAANIIVLLPLNENRFSSGTFATNWGFGYSFHGYTLQDCRNAIKECAEYYNIQAVDPETLCGINRINIRTCLGDGLHPTLEFHKKMGITLSKYII